MLRTNSWSKCRKLEYRVSNMNFLGFFLFLKIYLCNKYIWKVKSVVRMYFVIAPPLKEARWFHIIYIFYKYIRPVYSS